MRKFIEKLREDKGFTLAELLIVVAIIAVLVAIAIPVFTSQLEKSRDAASISNLRAAYAEAAAEYLTWDGGTYTADGESAVTNITKSGNTVTITVKNVTVESQKNNNWSGQANDISFTIYTDAGTTVKKGNATFTYDTSNGTWACTGVAASGS